MEPDRQPIHHQHYHCAVCGALNASTIYDDGTIDYQFEAHDIDLHRRVIERAKTAQWN